MVNEPLNNIGRVRNEQRRYGMPTNSTGHTQENANPNNVQAQTAVNEHGNRTERNNELTITTNFDIFVDLTLLKLDIINPSTQVINPQMIDKNKELLHIERYQEKLGLFLQML